MRCKTINDEQKTNISGHIWWGNSLLYSAIWSTNSVIVSAVVLPSPSFHCPHRLVWCGENSHRYPTTIHFPIPTMKNTPVTIMNFYSFFTHARALDPTHTQHTRTLSRFHWVQHIFRKIVENWPPFAFEFYRNHNHTMSDQTICFPNISIYKCSPINFCTAVGIQNAFVIDINIWRSSSSSLHCATQT